MTQPIRFIRPHLDTVNGSIVVRYERLTVVKLSDGRTRYSRRLHRDDSHAVVVDPCFASGEPCGYADDARLRDVDGDPLAWYAHLWVPVDAAPADVLAAIEQQGPLVTRLP